MRIHTRLAPGDFAKKSCLFVSGAEACENAVKVARAYTKRAGVIAFTSAYHGRTMATMAMNGKVAPYRAGMGLMTNGGTNRDLDDDDDDDDDIHN